MPNPHHIAAGVSVFCSLSFLQPEKNISNKTRPGTDLKIIFITDSFSV